MLHAKTTVQKSAVKSGLRWSQALAFQQRVREKPLVIVDWNGKLVSEAQACLRVTGSPTRASAGLYETLRTYQGQLYGLEEHLLRMNRSCASIGIPPECTPDWKSRVLRVLNQNGLSSNEARVRLVAYPANGSEDGLTAVFAWPINQPELDQKRNRGITAILASSHRLFGDPIFQIKSLNLLSTFLAIAEAKAAGADEAFFLNNLDELCEATYGNIILVTDSSRLITPPIESPCLPGITVKSVLQIAIENGFSCETRPISKDELLAADEILVCSSVSEIVPVTKLAGKPIGGAVPGPVGRLLYHKFREFVKSSLVTCNVPG